MTTITLTQDTYAGCDDAMYGWLSNTQLAAVLDGGSAAIIAVSPTGCEHNAHIDLDGIWLDDEHGYVQNTKGWTLDLHY